MSCRDAREHERLRTIIEEPRLRRYVRFDDLIQAFSVAGGVAPRLVHLAQAWKHLVQALDQDYSAFVFGAGLQKGLFLLHFQRQARRHLKRKRPGRFDVRSHPKLAINERVAFLKQAKEHGFFRVSRWLAHRFGTVRQKFHHRLVIFIFVEQFYGAKYRAALCEYVHAPVIVIFQLLRDRRGAAHCGDAGFSGENHSEFKIVVEAVLNHQLVARLENVQRQSGAGIEDYIEREERYPGVSHDLLSRGQAELTEQSQCRLHFVSRVHVSRILSDQNSVG
jgi:hypothetical protein